MQKTYCDHCGKEIAPKGFCAGIEIVSPKSKYYPTPIHPDLCDNCIKEFFKFINREDYFAQDSN